MSNLLLGIAGEESVPSAIKVLGQKRHNEFPDWATPSPTSAKQPDDPPTLDALGKPEKSDDNNIKANQWWN